MQEQKKLELFEEAARKQAELMEANILGRGIDNHLLGLREMARETLGELPPFFNDKTYKTMIEFKLSTSQVRISAPEYLFSTNLKKVNNFKKVKNVS